MLPLCQPEEGKGKANKPCPEWDSSRRSCSVVLGSRGQKAAGEKGTLGVTALPLLTAQGKAQAGRQGMFPWNVKSTVLTSGCNSSSSAFGADQGDFGFQSSQIPLCWAGLVPITPAEQGGSHRSGLATLKPCSIRFPLGIAALSTAQTAGGERRDLEMCRGM